MRANVAAGFPRCVGIYTPVMASAPLTQKNWYSVLGAKPSDSQAELKYKYQRLALVCHPDKQSRDAAAGPVEERAQRFIEIGQAWKILGDEESKREYDAQQRESEMTEACPVDDHIHVEDMSWNSDEQSYSCPCRCGGSYTVAEKEVEHISLIYCDSCSLIIEILQ
ncbi:dnaJ homolog subfamily C member 24 [Ascaphus truei]|uniref:dnaJ homolog subfamily C member 24 n=1 Tax=Ascaphus truei TaxID=8439 RepID=UPI003F590BB6